MSAGLGGGGAMYAPQVSPFSSSLMFVGCDMTGIYRTTDSGATWRMVDTRDANTRQTMDPNTARIRFSVVFDPNVQGRVIAAREKQILRVSTLSGADGSWSDFDVRNLPANVVVTAGAISKDASATFLLGTMAGVYKLDTTGWAAQSLPLAAGASNDILAILFVADPTANNKQIAFAATADQVYKWDGASWTSTGMPAGEAIGGLSGGSNATRYALFASRGTSGVFRYASDAASWTSANGSGTSALPTSGIDCQFYWRTGTALNDPNTTYVTNFPLSNTANCAPAIYKGTFGTSMSWAGVYDGFQNHTGTNLTPGWIEKEPPAGLGWGFGGVPQGFAVSPANSAVAVLTNMAAVHLTTNGGTSWKQVYTTQPSAGLWKTNGIDVTTTWNYYVTNGKHLLANSDIGLSSSSDGRNWQYVALPDRWNSVYEITFETGGTRMWAAVSGEHDLPHETQLDDDERDARHKDEITGAVLVSDDGGATWKYQAKNPGPSSPSLVAPAGAGYPVVSVLYRLDGTVPTLYASVWRQGVYRTTKDATTGQFGATWTQVGTFPVNSHVYQLRTDSANNLYVDVVATKKGGPWSVVNTGVFKLVGSSWIKLTSTTGPFTSIAPMDYTFGPSDVIYVAAVDTPVSSLRGGIWKGVIDSTGSAASWTQLSALNTAIANDPKAQKYHATDHIVAFSPASIGSTLYLTTITHGTWQSTNGGTTWTEAFKGLPFLSTQRVVPDSSSGQSQTRVTTFGGGVYTIVPIIVAGPTKTPAVDTAEIRWSTDQLTDSQIQYGTSTAYGSTSMLTDSPNGVKDHVQTLTGLTGRTTYHYRVVSKNSNGTVMSADDSFTTLTPQTFTLTVSKAGTGTGTVTSSPGTISCGTGTGCQNDFATNTVVTLTATPDATATFGSFSTNCTPVTGTPTQCKITMSAAATVTTTFDANRLIAAKDGTGGGTVTSSPGTISCGTTCQNDFNVNTVVTLTATPDASSNFTRFSANCAPVANTPNQCTITMSAAATVTTTFDAKTFTLTVSKGGTGTGTVTSSPGTISCGTGTACQNDFPANTVVTLTAVPDATATFGSFSTNCAPVTGTPTQCKITMSAAATVTTTFNANRLIAAKDGPGGGTVTSSPGTISCGTTCQNDFTVGTIVTLTATPDASSNFTRFSANCAPVTGTPNQCKITMSAAATVTTTFDAKTFTLTVSKAGTGGGTVTSSPGTISCGTGTACQNDFPANTVVTLTAVPDATATFGSFSTNCTPVTGTPTQCKITMSAAATVTTTFNANRLIAAKDGTGGGTVTSSPGTISCGTTCQNDFTVGTIVTLTATPDASSNFTRFSANCAPVAGTPNQCTITMSAAATVTTTFDAKAFTLIVSKAGTGGGTVTSSPGTISCGTGTGCQNDFPPSTVVTLTATPDATSTFGSFSANCTPVAGTPTQCKITMSAAATVTTTFNANRLIAAKDGTGGGTVTSSPGTISCGTTCQNDFTVGTIVTLTATPDASSNFTRFSANCAPVAGTPNQCTVTMSAAATVTTTFDAKAFTLMVSKAGTGGGTVTSSPGTISCGTGTGCQNDFPPSTVVTLTATPDATSTFGSFSANCTPVAGTPTQCKITMSAAATVTTTFNANRLTVARLGNGTGSVTSSPAGISCGTACSADFNVASNVTLTAIADPSSAFAGFGSNCAPVAGNPNACTITMSGAATVTATFNVSNVATAPVVAALFSDNFARTTGLGANWKTWYGSFTTDGSSAVSGAPPVNGNWASVVPSMGTDNYAVSSDIVIPAGSLFSGIVARGSPTQFDGDLYAAQISTDGSVNLYRRNAWTWTALGTSTAGVTSGVWYTLKLLVSGSNPVHLEVWLNGALQIEVNDGSTSQVLTGLPGIQNYDATVRYSSFAVYPAPLFNDNFTGTTGLGTKWKIWYGGFTTNGAAAVSGAPPVNGNWASVVPALNTNDYIVASDIVIPAGSFYSGLVGRGSATTFDDDLYAAQLSTDGSAYLYRRNAWTWTALGSAALGITANTRYSLKLVVSGTNPVHLEVWVNGVQQIVLDDSSTSRIQSGVPGIQNYDANVQYSSFAVYQGPMFIDTFNRTTGLGAGWSIAYGSYTTDGTAAISGAPPINGNWARVTTPLATSDYAVQADVVVPAGSVNSGLAVRSTVSTDFDSDVYAVKLGTDGTVRLYRRNSWNWTLLATANTSIVAGTKYTVKLLAIGTNPVHIEAWLNGALQVSYDDGSVSRLTTGAVGIENYDAGVKYSSLSVSKH